jgi:predicted small metal-binding protein
MEKVYRISCRDAGVDCDFQAEAPSMDEILRLCAEHGIQEHNMKGFGPELYLKMRSCVQIVEEGTPGSKEEGSRREYVPTSVSPRGSTTAGIACVGRPPDLRSRE